MPAPETLEYLESQVETEIDSFDSSRRFFRQRLFRFMIAAAILSALTTVLIGIGQILDLRWMAILSLMTSAGMTVIAAWDQYLSSRDLWVQKTDAYMALYMLRGNLDYAKSRYGVPLTQEQVDEFYAQFERILMGEHETWKKSRSAR